MQALVNHPASGLKRSTSRHCRRSVHWHGVKKLDHAATLPHYCRLRKRLDNMNSFVLATAGVGSAVEGKLLAGAESGFGCGNFIGVDKLQAFNLLQIVLGTVGLWHRQAIFCQRLIKLAA